MAARGTSLEVMTPTRLGSIRGGGEKESMSLTIEKGHGTLVLYIAAVLLAGVALAARADDPPAPIVVHGWVDGYYAWNSDHPEPKANFFSGTGPTPPHPNPLPFTSPPPTTPPHPHP